MVLERRDDTEGGPVSGDAAARRTRSVLRERDADEEEEDGRELHKEGEQEEEWDIEEQDGEEVELLLSFSSLTSSLSAFPHLFDLPHTFTNAYSHYQCHCPFLSPFPLYSLYRSDLTLSLSIQ